MAKQLRRLASEHNSLYSSPPPDYLFPEALRSDELTSLDAYLIGPTSTAYENGLWRIHLKISETYPREPPKATFRTKMWHPNVEERSGEICVDTLKTGWTATTTLRDVLSTIRSLLIHPNPASALNADAGMLAEEDYKSFTRQAKLMTKIHASVPASLKPLVKECRRKAEEESAASSTSKPKPALTTTALSSSAKEAVQSTGLGIHCLPPNPIKTMGDPENNILHTPTTENFANPSAESAQRLPFSEPLSAGKENATARPKSSGSNGKTLTTSPLGKRSMDDREAAAAMSTSSSTAEIMHSAAKVIKLNDEMMMKPTTPLKTVTSEEKPVLKKKTAPATAPSKGVKKAAVGGAAKKGLRRL